MIRTDEEKARSARLVVIGASAGGVEALKAVLPGKVSHAPIVIVLHRPEDRSSHLTAIFHAHSLNGAREPEDKEPLLPGHIYFAPGGYHLLVEKDFTFSLSLDPPLHYSRPAIDMLFDSAADTCGPSLLGIILTGANDDGASGLRCILDHGGSGVIQTPETAFSPEMPRAALKQCPEATVLTLPEIKQLLTPRK